MKKVSLLIAAFALVLGFSQCSKKPVMPSYSGPAGDRIIQNVTLNATQSNGGGDSKIADDGNGKVKWKNGDNIIVKQNGDKVGELKCTDPANDEFTGSIIASKEYDLIFEFGTREGFEDQTGDLDYAIKLSGKTQFEENGSYEVEMKMSDAAVLKLDLSYFAPSPSKADVTVNISVKAEAESKEEDVIASVKCASDKLGEVYVAVPANEKPATYTFSDGSRTVEMSWDNPLLGNTFYTAGGTGGAEVITPKFTVAAGKTVEFAPGNLWYGKADGEETAAFHFEANQWSFANSWKANHVSHFLWSPDKGVAVGTSTSVSGSASDVFFTNDPENETKPNENFQVSGETKGTWRTLSKDEWAYLLNTSGSSGRTDASRFAKAKVNNVCGLLIFPDGYKGATSGDGIATLNATAAAYPDNSVPDVTWTSMETSGAVFLPAAGRRNGTDVRNVGSYGCYWSSTPHEDQGDRAYSVYFDSGIVYASNVVREYGYSVRLVR